MATVRQVQTEFSPDYAIHPGETLAETLVEMDMSQAELAERTGRPRKTINGIMKGDVGITPETALQFERVLGIPARFWNNLQRQYEETLARLDERHKLEQYVDWARRFPLKALQDGGWLKRVDDPIERIRELLQFFGVASPNQWLQIWDEALVAFRKSPAFESNPEALSVWLRQGELQAQKIECEPFDAATFRTALHEIRSLTARPIDVGWPAAVARCASAGVALVLTPELPKTRVSGSTRWLTPSKALVQLSLRYKTDDHFWFTLCHEAAHILLHRKRVLFVEYDSSGPAQVADEQADKYARDLLIPPPALRKFLSEQTPPYISKAAILAFAGELQIAPGIVIGRLQHDGSLPPTHCNDLKVRISFADIGAGKTPETSLVSCPNRSEALWAPTPAMMV